MIVTEIFKGQGLGNQLWCYVVTRSIAADHGYDFGIQHPENFKCRDFMDIDTGRRIVGGNGPEGGPPTLLPEGIMQYYRERKITHPLSGEDISVFDPHLVNIPDGTKIDGNMQDEQYIVHHKEDIRRWLCVKLEYECYDFADDHTCVINFRGGEYTKIPRVFLKLSYYRHAIANMLKVNPRLRFVVITDDVVTARQYFPDFEVFHFSIAKDYVIIKNARYLILSNSSFAWFPAWLNENLQHCIAPKYWWGHNHSVGYWACGYNITSGWMYQNREGRLQSYDQCRQELREYSDTHPGYFIPNKINRNFLVVSAYNNDLAWIPARTNNYAIYDRSECPIYPYTLDHHKIVQSPNVGYNLYDYFTFIIDHYDQLPECTIFVKGNVFPRHVTEYFFDQISNTTAFTPLIDRSQISAKQPAGHLSKDGLFNEKNVPGVMPLLATKYFSSYNQFLRQCYRHPSIPKYIPFAPGANYIVPKLNILKLPKAFYQNLRTFVSHSALPGEAHIIERALYTLWTSDGELNESMTTPWVESTAAPQPHLPAAASGVRKFVPRVLQDAAWKMLRTSKSFSAEYMTPAAWYRRLFATVVRLRQATKPKKSPADLMAYRKSIHVYDAMHFFNELDLLELRLHILNNYVDYFVIVEATETFTGLPKPLWYEENKERFRKFWPKIIHYVIRDTPRDADDLRQRLYDRHLSMLDREIIHNTLTSDNVPPGKVHWLKEFFQKESLKKTLVGVSDRDFVYVSDVDEIWNPDAPIDVARDTLFKYQQVAYYYFLNNRSNDDWRTGWTGTVATQYKNINYHCLNHLRTHTKNTYIIIKNGGWHFTFQGGANQIRNKLASYGHKEFNTPEIRSSLEQAIATNQDYRGRKLKFTLDESSLPKYLQENRQKYLSFFK